MQSLLLFLALLFVSYFTEYDSNEPPEGIERPLSPIESYDYSMPPHDDYSVEPPTRPPIFRTAPLTENTDEDSTRAIRHVYLNHLFMPADQQQNDKVRTLATVERFKDDKFVTTIMVTKANKVGLMAERMKKRMEEGRGNDGSSAGGASSAGASGDGAGTGGRGDGPQPPSL